MEIDQILKEYSALLASVDRWYAGAMAEHCVSITCRRGCSECCRGLFDITLLDALLVKQGFERLPLSKQAAPLARASARLSELQRIWPELTEPYLLNLRPESDWDQLMPDEDETPCPLLDDDGCCLIYDHRPMTCRLHGLPLVDRSGEVFHDEWCTLNFAGEEPLKMETLRWEFESCFRSELSLFHKVTEEIFEERISELDTFIPLSLLFAFREFDWKGWWLDSREMIRSAGFPGSR